MKKFTKQTTTELNKRIMKIKEDLDILINKTERITDLFKKTKLPKDWDVNKYIYDPDSSPIAWTYFLSIYKELFSKDYNLENSFIEKDDEITSTFWIDKRAKYKRIYGTFTYANTKFTLTSSPLVVEKHSKKEATIGIAGDCCFNFNEKKVGLFAGLLCAENNPELRNTVMDLVFCFHKMHYSPLNFALMPSTGGLNDFKGTDKFDRLSYFLYWMDKSKISKCSKIFNCAQNRQLKDALSRFIEKIEYYKVFYPELDQDNELYKDLLTNGEKQIKSTEEIIEYLELAIRFWKAKAKYYDEQIRKG